MMLSYRSLASTLLVALALALTLGLGACSTAGTVAQDEELPPEEGNQYDFEERPGENGVPTEDGMLDEDVENEKLYEGIEGDEVE